MDLKVYRRPDQQWKCGLHASGNACPLGPNEQGRCESQRCHPQRTLRWWRSYLPIAFGALTLCAVITVIVTNRDREIIAPGPLSMAHAQLIQNSDDQQRCNSCHEESIESFKSSGSNRGKVSSSTQTERCLKCHDREFPQMKSASPHDLQSDELEALAARTRQVQETKNSRSWFVSLVKTKPIDWHQHELACSDCHREHQGSRHDLQTIASERCQACHQIQFDSFGDGHPEFSNYPRPSTSRLAFDHHRHRELHFAKNATAFDCRVCHLNNAEQGRVGQVFRANAFETACASCHLAPMKASLPEGVIVFQLPSVDIRGLAERGTDIGRWPEEAGQLLDGAIPPFMQLLLASDNEANSFSQQISNRVKLTDFQIDVSEDRQALSALATASRNLLEQLAHGGQPTLVDKLRSIVSSNDAPLVERIIQGVPPDLFRQAYRDWFESDSGEPAARNGLRVSIGTENNSLRRNKANDPLLTDPHLSDASNSENLLDSTSLTDELSDFDDLQPQSTTHKLKSDEAVAKWKTLKARQHLPSGGWMIDSQRMAIVYVPSGHADPWLTAMLTLARQIDQEQRSKPIDALKSSQVHHLHRLAKGLLEKNNALQCLECHQAFQSPMKNAVVEESPFHNTSGLDKAFVDLKNDRRDSIEKIWRAERFDASNRQLTHFDHGPHLIQPALSDCVACHRLNRQKESASLELASTISTIPDFEPMTKQDCAACHRPNAAGDGCTQCHHYHTNHSHAATREKSHE